MNNETQSVYICVAGEDTPDHKRAIDELQRAARDGLRDWWPINQDAEIDDLVLFYVTGSFVYSGRVSEPPQPVENYNNGEYGKYKPGTRAAYIDQIAPLPFGAVPLSAVANAMPGFGFVHQKQKGYQQIKRDFVEPLLALLKIDRDGSDVELAALVTAATTFCDGPESEAHRILKWYVARNPEIVGLPRGDPGETEAPLFSGDRLDVSFQRDDVWVAVEVKSRHAPEVDILRGVFQCVKYVAVMNATLTVLGHLPNARAILALESRMPARLSTWAKQLRVEVIEDVTPS